MYLNKEKQWYTRNLPGPSWLAVFVYWGHDNDISLETFVLVFGIIKNAELYKVTHTKYQDSLYLTLALNTNVLDNHIISTHSVGNKLSKLE